MTPKNNYISPKNKFSLEHVESMIIPEVTSTKIVKQVTFNNGCVVQNNGGFSEGVKNSALKIARKQTVGELFNIVSQNLTDKEKDVMRKSVQGKDQNFNLEKQIEKSSFMKRFINITKRTKKTEKDEIIDPIKEAEIQKLERITKIKNDF